MTHSVVVAGDATLKNGEMVGYLSESALNLQPYEHINNHTQLQPPTTM